MLDVHSKLRQFQGEEDPLVRVADLLAKVGAVMVACGRQQYSDTCLPAFSPPLPIPTLLSPKAVVCSPPPCCHPDLSCAAPPHTLLSPRAVMCSPPSPFVVTQSCRVLALLCAAPPSSLTPRAAVFWPSMSFS